MSERGIEIHNGYLDFPDGMPQTLHLGTESSPLTQGEAGQIVLSAVINALALGGDVKAGEFMVFASVSLTGTLRSLRAKTYVNDAITVTGSVYGAYIGFEILGTGSVTGYLEGLRLDNTVAAGADVSAVSIYGIFIVNSISSQPANYSFIRMSENGACTVRSVFMVYKGGSCIDMEYLFEFHGVPPSAWISSGGPLTGEAGWLKIIIGSDERYIQLYTTTP